MTVALLVAVAGGAGSSLRFLVDLAISTRGGRRAPKPGSLPWAAFAINVVGSLALGALVAGAAAGSVSDDLRRVLGIGVCGGFTTFSTAMVDTLRLALGRRTAWAVGYLLGSIVAATAAAALGRWLVSR